MKKLVSLVMLTIGMFVFAQNQVIKLNQLPVTGQQFIQTYFGSKNVSAVILDDDIIKKEYEVILTNGTKIEFDGSGNWKEVDGKRNSIPTGFAPKAIANYVRKSFPNTEIKKIEKKRFGYEVELTNGLDLDFDSKGNFKGIDD